MRQCARHGIYLQSFGKLLAYFKHGQDTVASHSMGSVNAIKS